MTNKFTLLLFCISIAYSQPPAEIISVKYYTSRSYNDSTVTSISFLMDVKNPKRIEAFLINFGYNTPDSCIKFSRWLKSRNFSVNPGSIDGNPEGYLMGGNLGDKWHRFYYSGNSILFTFDLAGYKLKDVNWYSVRIQYRTDCRPAPCTIKWDIKEHSDPKLIKLNLNNLGNCNRLIDY